MKNSIPVAVLVLILACGYVAMAIFTGRGVLGRILFGDTTSVAYANSVLESKYADTDGDCYVPAQGNYLYDKAYSELNATNCAALGGIMKDRAEATKTVAEAGAITSNAQVGRAMLNLLSAIVIFVIGVVLVRVFRP